MDIISIVRIIFPDAIQNGFVYETPCTHMYITNELMHISKISKCDQMAGNQTIERIIQLGHLLKNYTGIQQINLTDTSQIYLDISCSINMSTYFILSTGESWYNRAGFKSKNFEKEFNYNRIIRTWTLKEYYKNGLIELNKKKHNLFKNISVELKKSIIKRAEDYAMAYEEKFFDQFKELDKSASIGSIFSYVKENNILINCTEEKSKLLVRLINADFNILMYDSNLVYNL